MIAWLFHLKAKSRAKWLAQETWGILPWQTFYMQAVNELLERHKPLA